MPRWRIPLEVVVEAQTPAAARARVAQQLTRFAATATAPAALAQYHIAQATRADPPPRPLTIQRRSTA